MGPLFSEPPESVCILRLSSIGDVCNVLPVVRTLQHAWPKTRFTWLIGKVEATLLSGIPDVELVTYDKRRGVLASWDIARRLRGRRFELLLHMQSSLRASSVALGVPAGVRLGFDRQRARELQWLFTTHHIAQAEQQHVLDGFFGFAERSGVCERCYRWDIPISDEARDYAERVIPDGVSTLLISPCSSHPLRNWRAEYYERVADFAVAAYGMQVVLCGGQSALEGRIGEQITSHMRHKCHNLIGRDSLPKLLATLARATLLLTPDSGPAHMATAVGTPVLGLYAATNPRRSGPYFSRELCVDRYDAAARAFLGKPASALPWTAKIEHEGVMDLITPDDAIEKLASLMAQARQSPRVG